MGRMKNLALIAEEFGIPLGAPDAVGRALLAERAERLSLFFAGVRDAELYECPDCYGTGARGATGTCPVCAGTGVAGAGEPDPDAAYDRAREEALGW